MRTKPTIILVLLLVALAAAPWVIAAYVPHPLLPDDLRQSRQRYEATVAVAQEETREAANNAPSIATVHVIGTLRPAEGTMITILAPSPTPVATNPPATSIATVRVIGTVAVEATETGNPSHIATPAETAVTYTAVPEDTTAPPTMTTSTQPTTVSTGQPSPTVSRTATPAVAPGKLTSTPLPARTPAVSGTPTEPRSVPTSAGESPDGPPTPIGLKDTEDTLTEQMLEDQITHDAENDGLSDINVTLRSDGIEATAIAVAGPGITRKIDVKAEFAVEQFSLVAKVVSVRSGDSDLTSSYKAPLESRLNTSLYRLLPQRWVQSFELGDGYVRVYSKVRP